MSKIRPARTRGDGGDWGSNGALRPVWGACGEPYLGTWPQRMTSLLSSEHLKLLHTITIRTDETYTKPLPETRFSIPNAASTLSTMNNVPQTDTPLPPGQITSIPAPAPPVQMDPSTCHPVFFTDRLWKVAGARPGGSASPVSEGYAYQDPQANPRKGIAEFGPRL